MSSELQRTSSSQAPETGTNPTERQRKIEEWSVAAPEIILYGHTGQPLDPKKHHKLADIFGKRLIILGQEVMDTCEFPYSRKVVEEVMKRIKSTTPTILLRGLGLFGDAQASRKALSARGGGHLVIVELNHELATQGLEWARKEDEHDILAMTSLQDGSFVDVQVHEGDALEVTRNIFEGIKQEEAALQDLIDLPIDQMEFPLGQISKLADLIRKEYAKRGEMLSTETAARIAKERIKKNQVDKTGQAIEGSKIDAVISDTYPVDEREEGINDINDLKYVKRILKNGGVFAFFAFFPGGPEGDMAEFQRAIINKHFRMHTVISVDVNPPPSYKYLHHPDGRPVRRLPVVICEEPIVENENPETP